MKLVIHFPGKFHKELKINTKDIKLKEIIANLIQQGEFSEEYLNEEKFYSRFITLKNGRRFYDLDINCNKNDLVIVVAANKIKKVDISENKKHEEVNCNICGKSNVVFLDNRILDKNREIHLCKNCFKQKLENKIFNNISHFKLQDRSVIDFGISGERDSTIALYFLIQYRKKNNKSFKINCVFNSVGLGNYDKIRLDAAKETFRELCSKDDSFKINTLNIDFKNDYETNKDKIAFFSTKYCSLCTRTNGFREYGTYNGEDIYTASGSGTIEDCFTNKIMNKGATLPNKIVSSKFPKTVNFRRIIILDGILEDMISVFAAIENINYCVADCPFSKISPNYLCRENALNLIKAKTDWITSAYGEIDLMQDCTVLGKISAEKKLISRNKCVLTSTGNIYGINEFTVRGVIEGVKSESKPEKLERDFYKICNDSKQKYLNNNFEKYAKLFSNKYVKNINLMLNDIIIKTIENVYFIIDPNKDSIEPLYINDVEKEILFTIEKNKKIKVKELIDYTQKHDVNIKTKALQNLIALGIIKLDLPNKVNISKENLLYVIDEEHIMNNTYYKVLQDIFEVKRKNVCFEIKELFSMNKDDIILVMQSESNKIKEWYDKLKSVSAQVIYIYLSQPITIFTNDYEYIEKNWNISTECQQKISSKQKKKCRTQIISVLNEIMLCDINSITNKLKGYNVLYYINLFTGEKKKKLF